MLFHTFADVTAHLDQLGLFHMEFGLDRMRAALSRLGLGPGGRIARPVVQIVGTNGKGSTASFLAELLRGHGLKAGLFTSPHLASVQERIRIDGHMLPKSEWPALASTVYEAGPDLTYFEMLTVMAVLAFHEADVDCMILEAGMGGRYDATTAVPVDMVCFTPIALDHMSVLGPDLESIALDKAGAIRPKTPAFTAPQDASVLECLERTAKKLDAPLTIAAPVSALLYAPEHEVRLALPGEHQRFNAGLALAVWGRLADEYGWTASPNKEAEALACAFIPGRMQRISAQDALPPLLLDGAHNPHGLEALSKSLETMRIRPRAVVFTCMADKDTQAMLPLIKTIASRYGAPLFVPAIPGNPRASDPQTLVSGLGNAQACVDLEAALSAAARTAHDPEDPVLVCGSLYLLGEFFRLHPEWLELGT